MTFRTALIHSKQTV